MINKYPESHKCKRTTELRSEKSDEKSGKREIKVLRTRNDGTRRQIVISLALFIPSIVIFIIQVFCHEFIDPSRIQVKNQE